MKGIHSNCSLLLSHLFTRLFFYLQLATMLMPHTHHLSYPHNQQELAFPAQLSSAQLSLLQESTHFGTVQESNVPTSHLRIHTKTPSYLVRHHLTSDQDHYATGHLAFNPSVHRP